jgi:hypothetical protein
MPRSAELLLGAMRRLDRAEQELGAPFPFKGALPAKNSGEFSPGVEASQPKSLPVHLTQTAR